VVPHELLLLPILVPAQRNFTRQLHRARTAMALHMRLDAAADVGA
jgi:hypothetical protein